MSATKADEASTAPKARDVLASQVVDRLRGLVDGNGAVAADLAVQHASRIDRDLVLQLGVGLGWSSRWERGTGRQHPSGMNQFPSRGALDAALTADCIECRDQHSTAETLRKHIESTGPVEAFRTLKDGFKVVDVPGGWYFHDRCSTCYGHGKHQCRAIECNYGKVRCTGCLNGDGKQTCYACHGGGRITETFYTGSNAQTRSVTCRQCGGAGRWGNCGRCHGSGKINCPGCGGTSEVGCTPCGRTGWFLQRHWAWITGSTKRSSALASDAPPGFRSAFAATDMLRVPGIMGNVNSAAVTATPGECYIVLKCSLPHVHVDATCKDVGISVDAVGRDADIPAMPTFLDRLIGDLNRLVTSTSISPQAVIRSAESSRVTRHVLEASYTGNKFDPVAVSSAFARAASTEMLSEQHAAIVRAYDALGSATVRRFWLMAGPVCLLFAAWSATSGLRYTLVRLLRAPYQVAEYVFYGADAAVAVLPLLVLTFLCGRMARRRVRELTGSKAHRRPKQRPWPQLLLIVGAAAHYVPIFEGYTTPDVRFFRPSPSGYASHFPAGPAVSTSLAPVGPVGLHHPHHRHPG